MSPQSDDDIRAAAAERQRRFRERKLHSQDADSERLDVIVPIETKRQLERLARHKGMTQRDVLEWLLAGAERTVASKLTEDGRKRYFDGGA